MKNRLWIHKAETKIFWNEKEDGFTWVLGRPKRWSEQQMASKLQYCLSYLQMRPTCKADAEVRCFGPFGSVKCHKAWSSDSKTTLLGIWDVPKAAVHADRRLCKLQKQTKVHQLPEDEAQRNTRATMMCAKVHFWCHRQNLSSEFKSVAKQQQTLIICAETV